MEILRLSSLKHDEFMIPVGTGYLLYCMLLKVKTCSFWSFLNQLSFSHFYSQFILLSRPTVCLVFFTKYRYAFFQHCRIVMIKSFLQTGFTVSVKDVYYTVKNSILFKIIPQQNC